MTPAIRPLVLAAAALLCSCGEPPTSPTAALVPAASAPMHVTCDWLGDGYCWPGGGTTVTVASLDAQARSFTSALGDTYHVSDATRFYAVVLPPSPIFPNDPIFPFITSWNSLLRTTASPDAYLAQLGRLLPPSPIVPPNPILPPNPIRVSVVAELVGTSYLVSALAPDLGP